MQKPTVIVLASQKGGVGKTTLAAHLAVAADAAGIGTVAVYDTDPQQSLARWWDRREAETPYYARGGVDELDATLERLGEKGLRLLVIDTPARRDRGHPGGGAARGSCRGAHQTQHARP